MLFCELSIEEYRCFQMTHPHRNFLNALETKVLQEKEGHETLLVGVKEDDRVIAATMLVKLPVMKKFFYYYAPRGFLLDYENQDLVTYFVSELKRFAKQQGSVYILFDPYILYQQRDQDGNIVEDGFNHSYVIENLKKAGCIHQGFTRGYGKNMQWIRWMYSMDLSAYTKESLWKQLHQQTRWSINKTLKYQMQIKELSYDEMALFDDILEETGERRQFVSRGLSFYQNQYEAYRDHMKVLLAYMDIPLYKKTLLEQLEKEEQEREEILLELKKVPGSKKYAKKAKVIEEAIEVTHKRLKEADDLQKQYGDMIPMASSMFALYDNEVTYLTSGAYEQFRGFYASYAIQWHMINEALEKGYKKYNFYGISGVFDEHSIDYGVYKFKRGFPGQVEELVGDFVLPIRKNLYRLYELKNSLRK